MADLPIAKAYMPPHFAAWPGGPCSTCGDLWPCAVERTALLEEYRDARSSLLIYLCLHLIEALHRNPVELTAELYTRHLGWVPPPTSENAPASSAPRHHEDEPDARHAGRAA